MLLRLCSEQLTAWTCPSRIQSADFVALEGGRRLLRALLRVGCRRKPYSSSAGMLSK